MVSKDSRVVFLFKLVNSAISFRVKGMRWGNYSIAHVLLVLVLQDLSVRTASACPRVRVFRDVTGVGHLGLFFFPPH